jgi:2-keto-myo-inositol isomerase
MKIGYNGATAIEHSSLELDLQLTEKYGYDYIEIRVNMLEAYLQTHSVNELKCFFEKSHVKPCSINAIEDINFPEPLDEKRIMEETRSLCDFSKQIGNPYLVVVPTFGNEAKMHHSYEEIQRDTVRILVKIAGLAAEYGVKIAFEPIGMEDCLVRSIRQGWEIIKEVDRPDVGLALDLFNLYKFDAFKDIEDLNLISGDKIFIVHIDDCENHPLHELQHAHRLMPGDGIIDQKRFFQIMVEKGFQGPVSVELFNPIYYAMPVEQVIAMGKEKIQAVLKEAYKQA